MNNLILCSNDDELSIINIPTNINDTNIRTNHIKVSHKIERVHILYESDRCSILSIRMENFETKIYQFSKNESINEWNFSELNIQIKSNGYHSIVKNKNYVDQYILEASAMNEKLNFYISVINEQTLSNTRSYSIELPENMGGIDYVSYSIVKNKQLVTLRMQDSSLLVIRLTNNGGMTKKKFIRLI